MKFEKDNHRLKQAAQNKKVYGTSQGIQGFGAPQAS
jgi:hypothetical protein